MSEHSDKCERKGCNKDTTSWMICEHGRIDELVFRFRNEHIDENLCDKHRIERWNEEERATKWINRIERIKKQVRK